MPQHHRTHSVVIPDKLSSPRGFSGFYQPSRPLFGRCLVLLSPVIPLLVACLRLIASALSLHASIQLLVMDLGQPALLLHSPRPGAPKKGLSLLPTAHSASIRLSSSFSLFLTSRPYIPHSPLTCLSPDFGKTRLSVEAASCQRVNSPT